MIWVNRVNLYVFFCVVFWGSLLHAGLSSEALCEMIMAGVSRRVLSYAPFVVTDSIRVDVQNASEIVALYPQAVTVNVDWEGGKYQLLGRNVLPLVFRDEKQSVLGKYGAVVLVSAKAPVVETTQLLLRGSRVTSQDIRVQILEAHGQPVGAVRELSSGVGLEVVSTLQPNTILTSSMLRGVPDMLRGTLVTVVLVRDSLRFSCKGEALSDARVGQKVKVRLQMGAKRVVEGHVIDDKTVFLD